MDTLVLARGIAEILLQELRRGVPEIWRNPPVDTLPTSVLRFGWKGGVYRRYFCKCIIRILRAGRVILLVLRVPWCHARKFDAHTRITSSNLQLLLLALVPKYYLTMTNRGGLAWVTSPAMANSLQPRYNSPLAYGPIFSVHPTHLTPCDKRWRNNDHDTTTHRCIWRSIRMIRPATAI
jgi:hypothetical protein